MRLISESIHKGLKSPILEDIQEAEMVQMKIASRPASVGNISTIDTDQDKGER